jgi:hypothetical protein
MSSRHRSGRVSEVLSTGLSKKKGKAGGQLSIEEIIDSERTSLIRGRQSQLEAVVDKHDDHVCDSSEVVFPWTESS